MPLLKWHHLRVIHGHTELRSMGEGDEALPRLQ